MSDTAQPAVTADDEIIADHTQDHAADAVSTTERMRSEPEDHRTAYEGLRPRGGLRPFRKAPEPRAD